MSAVATAIAGGALIGGGLNYLGQQQAASGAQGAANLQANAASAARNSELSYSQGWGSQMTNLAQATPQELSALGQSYGAASQQLSQQQQLMNSVNPALMEASKQALQILQGGTAASSAGIMSMRNSQRAQLVNQLQGQYGPGAESTSVGQRALQQFDMQTNMMNQQTLGNLMGVAGDNSFNQGLQGSINGLQSVGQGYSALQNRMLGTQQNIGAATLGAMSGTNAAMINTAGSPYVGQTLQGQGLASLGSGITQTGGMLGSAYLMGNGIGGGFNNSGANPTSGMTGTQEGGGSAYGATPGFWNNPGAGSGGYVPMAAQGNSSWNY